MTCRVQSSRGVAQDERDFVLGVRESARTASSDEGDDREAGVRLRRVEGGGRVAQVQAAQEHDQAQRDASAPALRRKRADDEHWHATTADEEEGGTSQL